MKIAKIKPVKTPTRGTEKSAGIDFFIPNNFVEVTLRVGETVVIQSGIKVKVPRGFALISFNKSGVALKMGLQIGACVIDEDYQGEIHIHLTKISGAAITLEPGMKIAQFILLPIFYDKIESVDILDLYPDVSERGEGAFGSTGVK